MCIHVHMYMYTTHRKINITGGDIVTTMYFVSSLTVPNLVLHLNAVWLSARLTESVPLQSQCVPLTVELSLATLQPRFVNEILTQTQQSDFTYCFLGVARKFSLCFLYFFPAGSSLPSWDPPECSAVLCTLTQHASPQQLRYLSHRKQEKLFVFKNTVSLCSPRLASNSESSCLPFKSTGIISMYHLIKVPSPVSIFLFSPPYSGHLGAIKIRRKEKPEK